MTDISPATEAAAAFNAVWTLIDKTDRTPQEAAEMLTLAHGSRHLWSMAGGAREWSIGDWQISRAYALLGEGALARLFAQSALNLAHAHDLGPFLVAAAEEGLARALLASDDPGAAAQAARARALAHDLTDPEEREVVIADLDQLGL